MAEILTDISLQSDSVGLRSDLTLYSSHFGSDVIAESEFKTTLEVTSFDSDGNQVDEMLSDLHMESSTMNLVFHELAESSSSILHFAKFFNIQFEEDFLWTMLSQSGTQQIDRSHLDVVFTAIQALSLKLDRFVDASGEDNLLSTWQDLQDFLAGVKDNTLLAAIKNALTWDKLEPILKDKFLSKIDDDSAAGMIKFVKGITVGETYSDDNEDDGIGTGAKLYEYVSNGQKYTKLILDYLTVRKKAVFTELEIAKIKAVGGQVILTPASMEIDHLVDGEIYVYTEDDLADGNHDSDFCAVGDRVYRCYAKKDDEDGTTTTIEFQAGDLAKCQTFNAATLIDGFKNGVSNSYYWRLVTHVDNASGYVDLSVDKMDVGSTVPKAGDSIVQFGNVGLDNDGKSRQKAIVISAYGNGAPSLIMYDGIGDVNTVTEDSEGNPVSSVDYSKMFTVDALNIVYSLSLKSRNYSGDEVAKKLMQNTTYGDMYVGTRLYDKDNRPIDLNELNNELNLYSDNAAYYRDSDASFMAFDSQEKKLILHGTLVEHQFGERKPITYFRGEYNPNSRYVWYDVVTYTKDGTTTSYIHKEKASGPQSTEEGAIDVSPNNSTYWSVYSSGSDGYAYFKSTVFKKSNLEPSAPGRGTNKGEKDYGGTFDDPVPYGWSDGVPADDGYDNAAATIWMTSRTFSNKPDYNDSDDSKWTTPTKASDSGDLDIEWSCMDLASVLSPKRNSPNDSSVESLYHYKYNSDYKTIYDYGSADINNCCDENGWFDNIPSGISDKVIWMATRKIKNGVYDGDWQISKTKGEKGEGYVTVNLTNDADGIFVGSDKKYQGEDKTFSTNVQAFYGGVQVAITQVNITTSDTSVISSKLSTKTGNPDYAVLDVTLKGNVDAELSPSNKIKFKVTTSYGSADAYYTLSCIPTGTDGETVAIYTSSDVVTYNPNTEVFSVDSVSFGVRSYTTKSLPQDLYTNSNKIELYIDGSTSPYSFIAGTDELPVLIPSIDISGKNNGSYYFKSEVKIRFCYYYGGTYYEADQETVPIIPYGTNGKKGDSGDSVVVIYCNSDSTPETPDNGDNECPAGWRTTIE